MLSVVGDGSSTESLILLKWGESMLVTQKEVECSEPNYFNAFTDEGRDTENSFLNVKQTESAFTCSENSF